MQTFIANPLTKRGRLLSILSALRTERASFIPHWRDLGEYIKPRRPRFTIVDINRGEKRSQKIIDSTGTFSARTLSSGMMSGITSPARQWFRLTHPDPAVNEQAEVKAWLHVVTQRMNVVLTRSNFYNSLIELYDDLGTFGTSAMCILEDKKKVIHTETYPVGSYMLGVDHQRKVQQFAREYQLKVHQIVQMYGCKNPDRPDYSEDAIDWSRISNVVQRSWKEQRYNDLVPVAMMILPNWGIGGSYDGVSMLSENKRYQQAVFEVSSDGEKILSLSGFDEFPIIAPRWSVTGEDTYASDCPGMTALGDIKQLQAGEKKALKAADKMIDPPLIGPSRMKRSRISTLPSDITFADTREGELGLRPTYQVNFDLAAMESKQAQCRARIERAFFADLFLMVSQSEAMDRRSDVTAREIEERHEEKFLALGPVLERLNEDGLDPAIDRVFNVMARRDMLPDPPEELDGAELKVEYLSIMAQAQKMIGLGAIERTANFVGVIAQTKPDVYDKFDADEAVDQYADMAGIPPQLIVADEKVAEVRQARAKQQQAAQQAATMAEGAKAAHLLSKADTRGDNALTDLLRGITQPGAVPDQNAELEAALRQPVEV